MSSQQPPIVLVPPPAQLAGEGPPAKKKRGPKPKPKPYIAPKPVSRNERRYSLEKKREVLMFLEHHRVKNRPGQPVRIRGGEERLEGEYRRPTLDEAAEWFKIPYGSIHNWYKNKDTIFDPSLKGPRTRRKRDASGKLVDRNQPDAPTQGESTTSTPNESSSPNDQPTGASPAPGREPSIPTPAAAHECSPAQPGSSSRPGPATSPIARILSSRRGLAAQPDESRPSAAVAENARPAAGAEESITSLSQGIPRPSTSPAAGVNGSAQTETSTATPEQAKTSEPTAPKGPTRDV